jgi:hypothetical protein
LEKIHVFGTFGKNTTFGSRSGKFRLLEADPKNLDFWKQKLTIEKREKRVFPKNSLFSSKIYFSGPDLETQPAPTAPNSAQNFIV